MILFVATESKAVATKDWGGKGVEWSLVGESLFLWWSNPGIK